MTYSKEEHNTILALCQSQNAAKWNSIPDFPIALLPQDQRPPQPLTHKSGLSYKGGWMYVKITRIQPSPIKMHIPLKHWNENGLMLANIINGLQIRCIDAIKTVNNFNQAHYDPASQGSRFLSKTCITIYFNPHSSYLDFVNAIDAINKKLEAVNAICPIKPGHAAKSDLKLGKYCGITIDRDATGYLSPLKDKTANHKRKQLMKSSMEIRQIKGTLDLITELEKYIQKLKTRKTTLKSKPLDLPQQFLSLGFFKKKHPFTPKQKQDAALALLEAIRTQDFSLIQNHLAVLNRGSLKKITKNWWGLNSREASKPIRKI